MIFDSIPEYLKEQAKIYYGITEFPPEPNTCTWKLVCGCRKNQKERSFLIQNGQHAAIYMVALDSSLDMMPFEESHFKRPDVQILFADIEEKLIFGRFDKYLYKLIPNIYLNDDDTETNSFSAKVFINDDTKHLQREREKLAEIAKGRLVAASLDKDQARNIIYSTFHIINSYLKFHYCNEYVITIYTINNWFCEGEHIDLTIHNYAHNKTLEQCYEWVSQPGRQVGDMWGDPISWNAWLDWNWAKTGRRSWGWVGTRRWTTVHTKLHAINRVIRKEQYYTVERGGCWYSVRGSQYLNEHKQGWKITFNDFNYTKGFSYENIVEDLGLNEPPPLQEDENQEQPIDTSLITNSSNSETNNDNGGEANNG